MGLWLVVVLVVVGSGCGFVGFSREEKEIERKKEEGTLKQSLPA